MYETLFAKIEETLKSVPQVKDVFCTPKTKLDKAPAVFFKPQPFENAFDSNRENRKVYRFLVLVLIPANGTTVAKIFKETLPRTVDAIVAKFDTQWNQGTIDGHRVVAKIDSGDEWQVGEEQDGLTAYAPLNLEIRVNTDV